MDSLRRKEFAAIPPQPSEDGADKINHHVPGIAGRAAQQMRADHFKENRPYDGVKRELTPSGRSIGGAQTKALLQPEQQWQRAGHQQEIVKMKPEECIMGVRLNTPAIEGVQGTRNQKQTVAEIPKFFHSKTRMAKPKATATSSFKTRIMLTTLHQMVGCFQKFF
jgi:hypothetical protein